MTKTSTFEVAFRRRRQEKTNYRKRLFMVKSKKPRIVVRKSNKSMIVQVINFEPKGDRTVCSAVSRELKKFGWDFGASNISSAYLTGFLCGTRAKKNNVKEAILDIGLQTPIHGSRVFASLKGFVDAGVTVPADAVVFPKEERLKGKHLAKKDATEHFEKVIKAIQQNSGGVNG